MDASPAVMMRNAMQKLAKRWTRRFDDMAQKLADRFANDAMKNADASLATAFECGVYCRVQNDLADE
jgi:hypothetical protein